ncbi:outer membrane beta-barrel protein [uncultured Rhodoblastus sp.]|uniref:outer membrane beta-barrel protein n=1 Tax=uncultured Rhodoblastus sp. TaxID=543037 RepID=UPI0025CDD9CA|nr:outer membrane beta-barrel protein [uncultured Rhodoblastus sp.]
MASNSAFADDVAPSFAAQGAAIPGSATPEALASGAGANQSYGIPYGSWMLYPSIFVGGVFNSNVYQTQANQTAAGGARLTPNIEADLDNGLHKTTVYANVDAQLYPGATSKLGQTATTVSGRVGLAHIWSPTSDIVARFSVDYTRQDGPFGATLATSVPIGSATAFVGAPVALNANGFRQFSNQTTVLASVEKTLTGQTFVRVGVGAQQLIYEAAPRGYFGGQNGIDSNAFVRGGFWVTPLVNVFVETGGDLRRYYGSSFYDANSYRAIAGLASDMIGLVRGQIYGGLQQQFSTQGTFRDLTKPALGFSLTYYPLEYLTIAASLSNSFGAPGSSSPNAVVSANNETWQARLQADYALFEYWRASVRAGYTDTLYTSNSTSSRAWLAGAGFSYNLWRNVALTVDYQFTRTNSLGVSATSYSQNLATAGVTYRY